jgi:PAS domain S-box-containing protein
MENDLTRVVHALPGMVCSLLPSGAIDFVNRRWCDYTGLGADASLGQGWLGAIHADDIGALRACCGSLGNTEASRDVDIRVLGSNGVYRWFTIQFAPLTDANDHVVKWCGICTDIDTRIRAEDAARVREQRFQLILDRLPGIVGLFSPHGPIVFANKHMEEFLGQTLVQMQTGAPGFTYHPEDRGKVLKLWRECQTSGETFEMLARQRRFDGVYRWCRLTGFPLRDSDGQIILWYSLYTDIDDALRAEQTLAGEKSLLEVVARGMPLPEALETLCKLVEELSPGCLCSILLYESGQHRFFHGAAPNIPDSYNHVFDGKDVDRDYGPCSLAATIKKQVVTRDVLDDARWRASAWPALAVSHNLRSCWSTPVMSPDREVLGVFALYTHEPADPGRQQQDLIARFSHIASIAIARTRSDEELRRREGFLAEGQRLSATGTFFWRVGVDELRFTDELHRIFELAHDTAITLDMIATRVHPDDLRLFREMVDNGENDRGGLEYRVRLRMPDGRIKHVFTVARGSRNGAGQLEYIGAVQDITERLLSEDALNKLRSDLAHMSRVTSLGTLTASIAHEVSQPLAGIVTNANTSVRMLAAEPPNVAGALETARRTIRDANRATDVVKRLRALFSKKDATFEPIDLNDAAQEVISLTVGELIRNQVALRTEFAEDLPQVPGDRVQLQQVILNLILNASDAMNGIEDRPRQIVVRTAPANGGAQLTVQDSGTGIAPDAAEKIFEAFYSTKSAGMGIGLSVSRSIIEQHGGRIWAAQNTTRGASFSFSLAAG